MSTRGHGGKECVHEQYWNKREIELIGDFFYLFHGKGASVAVYHCPACGIELKSDPLPLPVPEGACDIDSRASTQHFGISVDPWEIEAWEQTEYGKRRLFILHGAGKINTEAAWRKAFGK